MNDALLDIRDATVTFPGVRGLFRGSRPAVHAVNGVDLSLGHDETVALVGESGSGKSTLGLSILGLRRLSSGDIAWRGKSVAALSGADLRAFHRDVQIVFQDPYGSLNPRLSIGETLRRPLALHHVVPKEDRTAHVEQGLEAVGLRPADLYIDRFPHEFSGGQRQRIAIARALILRPTLVVADEPVSALDVSLRAQILSLFQKLRSELSFSLLFLSHDLGVVRFIADRVAVMYLGKLVEIGPVEDIFLRPHHPYTKMLLSAAPAIRGAPPAALRRFEGAGEARAGPTPASGCRFHSRCPVAVARCREEEPAARPIGTGRLSACHLD
jgi:oligopeptide/dipeptide ABC transporter ATP-binding protein